MDCNKNSTNIHRLLKIILNNILSLINYVSLLKCLKITYEYDQSSRIHCYIILLYMKRFLPIKTCIIITMTYGILWTKKNYYIKSIRRFYFSNNWNEILRSNKQIYSIFEKSWIFCLQKKIFSQINVRDNLLPKYLPWNQILLMIF